MPKHTMKAKPNHRITDDNPPVDVKTNTETPILEENFSPSKEVRAGFAAAENLSASAWDEIKDVLTNNHFAETLSDLEKWTTKNVVNPAMELIDTKFNNLADDLDKLDVKVPEELALNKGIDARDPNEIDGHTK